MLSRSAAVLGKALRGDRRLSRPACTRASSALVSGRNGGRGATSFWHCAHHGLICFAARDGNQHTFALLDEWLPPSGGPDRDEALAELARRYFTSHGPATLKDFVWWSGLSVGDARLRDRADRAAAAQDDDRRDGYWHAESTRRPVAPGHAVLLPPYDEYTVAYQDRRAALDPKHVAAARNGIFSPTILLDGRIIGTWTRRLTSGAVTIALTPFARLTGERRRAVAAAADRYGRFMGRPARIV